MILSIFFCVFWPSAYLWKTSIQILYSFFNRFYCYLFLLFVMLSCMNYIQINHWYILDINPLSVYNLKYLILFKVNDHLILLIIFFAVQRLFFVIFWYSYICLILIFIYFKKTHPWNKPYLIMVHDPFSESESCSVVSDHLHHKWTIQSMEFSRPEHWGEQPFPSLGDLPNQGSNPSRSLSLQADSLPAEPQGKSVIPLIYIFNFIF